MEYLLKVTNVYRVPTVADALTLRDSLSKTDCGTLTAFSYTTKYIKKGGEILEEYQLCKATIEFNEEKSPEQNVKIIYE